MIPLREFFDLAKALPRASITVPKDQTSYIIDKNGDRIGDINWEMQTVTIYEEYEYGREVQRAIGDEKFDIS